jgi:hypothetical protein
MRRSAFRDDPPVAATPASRFGSPMAPESVQKIKPSASEFCRFGDRGVVSIAAEL